MRRFAYWWRVMRAGSPAVWSIVGAILVFVGGSLILTTDWALKHRVWGIILVAAAILVAILEGSYREIRRLEQDHRNKIIGLRSEHEADLARLRVEHLAELTQRQAAEKELAESRRPEGRPLEARYDQSSRYQYSIGTITEHRVGILNPVGNPSATGVRLEWTDMSPRPRVLNERFEPQIPSAVPRLTGGDPAIGISLPPGQQELWVVVTTAAPAEGPMLAGEFGGGYGSSSGNWHGMPWNLEPGKQWRLSYRIVADNLPVATFSIVMTTADGHVQCDLEPSAA